MNSVPYAQSNVDSLPPPKVEVGILAQLPIEILSPVLASLHSLPLNEPTKKRLVKSRSHRAATKTETWLPDTMLSRWTVYRERLRECQNKPTADSVHQLRVATRRLISQLVLVSEIFPSRKAQKIRKVLKRQLESLGDLRDAHILQIMFRRKVAQFPDLVDLLARLERRETSLVRRASRKILRFKLKKVQSWVHTITELLQDQSDNLRERREIANIALERANAAFAEVAGRWRLINRSDVRTIHRTRVAFKKFRYIAEVLPPELSGLSRRRLRALAWYQRKMGNIQDLEVIQTCVNEFIQGHERLGSRLKPFCTYLRRRRTRALWLFPKSADEL